MNKLKKFLLSTAVLTIGFAEISKSENPFSSLEESCVFVTARQATALSSILKQPLKAASVEGVPGSSQMDFPKEDMEVSDVSVEPGSTRVAGFSLEEAIKLGQYAKYAYSNFENPAHPVMKELERMQGSGHKVTFFGNAAEHSGLIIEQPDGQIVVAYHGTESLRNVGTDLDARLVCSKTMKGRFHAGFYNGFKSTQDILVAKLEQIASVRGVALKDLPITVTGHSMGAGNAQIAAKYLKEVVQVERVKAALYAPPRALDVVAAEHFEELLGTNVLNVIQQGYDPVPRVLPGFMGAKHVGRKVFLPKHIGDTLHTMVGYLNALHALDQTGVVKITKAGWTSGESTETFEFKETKTQVGFLQDLNHQFHKKVLYPVQSALKKVKDTIVSKGKSVLSKLKFW